MKRVAVAINEEYIKLDSFLKFSGALETGGRAKIVINDGYVKVNDELCKMRGKKIRPGDKVEFGGIVYVCERAGV